MRTVVVRISLQLYIRLGSQGMGLVLLHCKALCIRSRLSEQDINHNLHSLEMSFLLLQLIAELSWP